VKFATQFAFHVVPPSVEYENTSRYDAGVISDVMLRM
jgi:hypothetical protein